MQILDLTHLMSPDMPVYPGKGQPVIKTAATIETDGYREMSLHLDGHTGTHIDSPAHMLVNGRMLNDFPVSGFSGKAVVIPVPEDVAEIGPEFLAPYEEQIRNSSFVLFNTGWSRYWGSDKYFRNFPVLTEQAANWLVTFNLKGIGIDAISVDPVESTTWAIHHILFRHEMVIVENLIFPENYASGLGVFHCFPLSFMNADGSPVRAVLEIQ
jgi:kynurenine formamidase